MEVVPQVLDTLVGEVPAEYSVLNLLKQIEQNELESQVFSGCN